MAQGPKPVGHLTQFCKIPEMSRVIRITLRCDSKEAPVAGNRQRPAALRDLQVEADPLPIDQDRSHINQQQINSSQRRARHCAMADQRRHEYRRSGPGCRPC